MKKALPSTIKEHTAGRTIEFYYDSWAEKFTHKWRLKPPTNDKQWKLLFESLDVRDEEEQVILKALISEYKAVKGGRKLFDYDLTLKLLIKID